MAMMQRKMGETHGSSHCWEVDLWSSYQSQTLENMCNVNAMLMWWNMSHFDFLKHDIDDLVQDCNNSSANALELAQSCAKLLT